MHIFAFNYFAIFLLGSTDTMVQFKCTKYYNFGTWCWHDMMLICSWSTAREYQSLFQRDSPYITVVLYLWYTYIRRTVPKYPVERHKCLKKKNKQMLHSLRLQNIPWEDKVGAESQLSFTSTAPATHEAPVHCIQCIAVQYAYNAQGDYNAMRLLARLQCIASSVLHAL